MKAIQISGSTGQVSEVEIEVEEDLVVILAESKAEAKERVNRERHRRIALGFVWNGIPVQTRSDADFANITGIAQMARQMIAEGDSETTIPFRDAENVTHDLTPAQVVALGVAAFQHKAGHFAASWAIKDAIEAAEDMTALKAVYNVYSTREANEL